MMYIKIFPLYIYKILSSNPISPENNNIKDDNVNSATSASYQSEKSETDYKNFETFKIMNAIRMLEDKYNSDMTEGNKVKCKVEKVETSVYIKGDKYNKNTLPDDKEEKPEETDAKIISDNRFNEILHIIMRFWAIIFNYFYMRYKRNNLDVD